MRRLGQGGFATLEVILMVTVIGILASIAVPRFTDITARANTAKVQSDLTTIDTAIAVYNLRTGGWPATPQALVDSKDLADLPTPPTSGSIFVGSDTATAIPTSATAYSINTDHRATFDGKTAGEYYYKTPTSGTPSADNGGT